MTTAQVVETSVTVNNNSPIQDYVHPDDRCRFAFHFGGLYMQGRFFFVRMSEESVIDYGDRLQGGIIVRKTI